MDRMISVYTNIRKWLAFLVLFPLSLLSVLPENAMATYQFDKVRFILSTDNTVDSVRVTNPDKDITTNLQITAMQWSQQNGKDVYTKTKDLIIAPPILKIPPGKTQLVRIGWRRPFALDKELAYRIYIKDLTPFTAILHNQIRLKIEVSMPVFIVPPTPIYQVEWQVKRIGSNQLQVTVNNKGNMHIQVGDLTVTNANNQIIANTTAAAYILPQQSLSALLKTKIPVGNTATITAATDHGKLTANVAVS